MIANLATMAIASLLYVAAAPTARAAEPLRLNGNAAHEFIALLATSYHVDEISNSQFDWNLSVDSVRCTALPGAAPICQLTAGGANVAAATPEADANMLKVLTGLGIASSNMGLTTAAAKDIFCVFGGPQSLAANCSLTAATVGAQ